MPEGRAPGLDKVLITDTAGTALGTVGNPLITSAGGGPAATVNQGTQGSIASPWFVRPTADGATTSLPLPTGAATSAKQPALGTAGSASADVLSVQGVVGGTTLPVTVSNAFALDATLTGGSQTTRLTDGSNAVSVLNAAPTTQYGLVVRTVPAAATAPDGVELSDGSAFYTAAKTGQLPTALGSTTAAASLSVALASDQVGTAGTGSAVVLTVQGNAGGTPLPVSGSVTASGTVTANQGTAAAATAPWSAQLSDGAAAYTAAKTGQLPTALGATTKAASLSVAPATDSVGTAGTASATVYSVQGVASMTALQVTPPAGIGQQTLANSLSVGLNSSQVGTAGSAATTVLSVQGVASGTSLPVVPAPATGTYITANATTTAITGSAAILYAICVNPGITSALLIYNSNGTNANLVYSGSTAAPPNMYDITFGSTGMSMPNGITYTTSGGTPASVLFLWRAA